MRGSNETGDRVRHVSARDDMGSSARYRRVGTAPAAAGSVLSVAMPLAFAAPSAALPLISALALAATALAQSPQVSLRHDVPGDLVAGAPAGVERMLSLARGGPGYLAVWADERGTSTAAAPWSIESDSDVWFQRLGPGGAPLDPTPTCIAFMADRATFPRASWNGTSWLVTWQRQPQWATNFGTELVGARVRVDGTLVDPTPFTIASGTILQHDVASDSAGWVVLTSTSPSTLTARRVGTSPQQPLGASVTVASTNAQGIAIAHAQGTFLCTWGAPGASGNLDVFGRRLDTNLTALDGAPLVLAATAQGDSGPVLASNGAEFFLAWYASDSFSQQAQILSRRVSVAGQALGVPSAVTNWIFDGASPRSATWAGGQWVIGFNDQAQARLARVDAAGVVVDFGGFAIRPGTAPQFLWTLAEASQGGVLVGRSQSVGLNASIGHDVLVTEVTGPAGVGPDWTLGRAAPAQLCASLATDGTGVALACVSRLSDASRVLVARLDALGDPLDPAPREVAVEVSASEVDIAWDGTRYLVAWVVPGATGVGGTVRVRRMAPDGTFLDPAPVTLGPGARLAVAARSGEFALASVDGPMVGAVNRFWRIRGQDGAVVQGPTSFTIGLPTRVDVVGHAGGYVLAWDVYAFGSGANRIWTQTVDVNGNFGPTTVILHDGVGFGSFALAATGNTVLYAWTTEGPFVPAARLMAQRLDTTLTPLDPAPFEVARGAPGEVGFQAPEVAWDGAQFVCVYQSARGAGAPHHARSDVRGARILPNGTSRDPLGFVLEGTTASEIEPAIVGLGAGRALCASSVMRAEPPLAAYRVGARVLDGDCAPPASYCAAKLTSLGTLPNIGSLGSPSVAASDLEVTLSACVPSSIGMVVSSPLANNAPLFGGTLCIQVPFTRGALVGLDATGAARVAVPLDPSLVGATRHFQWVARDAGHPDGTGVALSNGLRLVVCP